MQAFLNQQCYFIIIYAHSLVLNCFGLTSRSKECQLFIEHFALHQEGLGSVPPWHFWSKSALPLDQNPSDHSSMGSGWEGKGALVVCNFRALTVMIHQHVDVEVTNTALNLPITSVWEDPWCWTKQHWSWRNYSWCIFRCTWKQGSFKAKVWVHFHTNWEIWARAFGVLCVCKLLSSR